MNGLYDSEWMYFMSYSKKNILQKKRNKTFITLLSKYADILLFDPIENYILETDKNHHLRNTKQILQTYFDSYNAWSYNQKSKWLYKLLEKLLLNKKKFILIGRSQGCFYAMNFANMYAKQTKKLICLDPPNHDLKHYLFMKYQGIWYNEYKKFKNKQIIRNNVRKCFLFSI